MNAILTIASPSDRALLDSEWGPSRREIAESAALEQRDAITLAPEDN